MTDAEHLAAAPFTDPHDGITTFHADKVQEMDARLAEHCKCRAVPHQFRDVHLSLEVCTFAGQDETVSCQDAMAYMLEDLHDNLWWDHTCYRPVVS